MNKTKDQLKGEIRYAIRLCQRQSRFYRRIQSVGVFFSIIGGSATFSILMTSMPHGLSFFGAGLLACSGAALIAIRPADKAALNESDIRRYQTLMVKLNALNEADIETAIEEARQSDVQDIESLRNVAFNDVMREINRDDQIIQLSPAEKLMALFA
jgi:hypothetical protein